MNINLYAFIITLISGFSTLIGFLIIYIKKDKNNIISKSLGFASGVMLSISIIDLIPNSLLLLIKLHNIYESLFLILMAFLAGIFISNIINDKVEKKLNKNLKLYKLGIISMFVIVLHNIPEGIITYITTTNNTKLGISLGIAIALHNIPEGISISIPIYYSTNNKFKSFKYTLVSALSEPIGAIITYLFLSNIITSNILGIIYSIVAGMMINISINELYKESINYNKNNTKIYFIIGFILMLINHLLFN